jgi:type II secretory pathway pseudopilin PulG
MNTVATAAKKPGGYLRRWTGDSSHRGFTLVEVVLAIGVIAFAVIPIIGSLAVAMESSRLAELDLKKTLLTRTVRSHLQTEAASGLTRFDNLVDELRATGGRTIYLAEDGRLLPFSGTTPTNAYARCQVAIGPNGFSTDAPDRAIATMTLQFPAPIYATEFTTILPLSRYGTLW